MLTAHSMYGKSTSELLPRVWFILTVSNVDSFKRNLRKSDWVYHNKMATDCNKQKCIIIYKLKQMKQINYKPLVMLNHYLRF